MEEYLSLKIFGNNAFGKVSVRCKLGASIINFLMKKKTIFSPSGGIRSHVPVHAPSLNGKTFKSAVINLL
jgi:hypothetical protein